MSDSMYSLGFIFLCASAMVWAGHVPQKPFYELEQAEQYFNEFIITYGREYSSESEKQKRFEIFEETLRQINEKNADPDSTAVYGVNKFSDLEKAEFLKWYTGLVLPSSSDEVEAMEVKGPLSKSIPDNFDWRDHNAVTSVKEQGGCGSCYAFSAIGALEGAYAIKHNKTISLSVQQVVDCDDLDNHCDGGHMREVYLYLLKVGGSESEQDYPYTSRNGECKFENKKVQAVVSTFKPVYIKDEEALRETLIDYGPISVGICAYDMQGYRNGIMNKCMDNYIDHGVVLVGYGTENGTPYWTLKNSWGTDFGEKGYFRIKRGIDACGIRKYATAVVAE